MKIKILSPNKKIYEGESSEITLPGQKGEFQILENHAPLFSLLTKGKIVLDNNKEIPIFSGIVNVSNKRVNILVRELES